MCNSYNVRKLKASEIEIKPCQVAKDKSWVQVLLYKTSRVDMQVLTEMYGSKWKSDYQMVGDSLFCTISIYDDEMKEWISRTDCGEKDAGISEEKSYATSAFKRAATQFGIGIELYTTPRIKFNTPDSYYYNDKLTMTFTVKSIEWDGDKLVDLVIVDRYGKEVYNFKNGNEQPVESKPADNATILKEFCSSKKGTVDTETLKEFYSYWNSRIEKDDFKGTMNPESLWKKHIARKAA